MAWSGHVITQGCIIHSLLLKTHAVACHQAMGKGALAWGMCCVMQPAAVWYAFACTEWAKVAQAFESPCVISSTGALGLLGLLRL